MPHLPRRAQHAQVVAVREDTPAPPERPVHGECEARGEGFHAAGERLASGGLDDEVGVVVLEGVVDEPEASALAAAAEGVLQGAHDAGEAQGGEPGAHLQRDVAGPRAGEGLPGAVAHARVRPGAPAGARARIVPERSAVEGELGLCRRCSHNCV